MVDIESMRSRSPLRTRRKKSSEKKITRLDTIDSEPISGELGAEILKIKQLINKKITNLDEDVLERE